jgi:aspartyl-tRNA(Asn)/glutamyl-tRNA(Gln) amidotransferase subunit A
MLSDDVLYLPIRELGVRIRTKKLSVVELTQGYLDRSDAIGPKLNAYATVTRELALKQAHAADEEIAAGKYRGPLHGIPYAAKDLVAVKGYPTTWGAPPYAKQTYDYNAGIIDRLNNAGSVLIGKAAMIELAGGLGYSDGNASLTGPARNPWNMKDWTCGSSSGSGAVVSAALAPWAIGSDTRGSTICPGAWCGIAGMRPSFGRVTRSGAMAIAWTTDKLCPMARTADDCGLIMSVISGHDPRDRNTLPATLSDFRWTSFEEEPKRPLRIGHLTNAFNRLAPGLEDAVAEAVKVMERAGAKVTDAKLPDGPYEELCELTIMMEAASAFKALIESGRCAELIDPLGKINGYSSGEFTAVDYLQVQRVRTFLMDKVDRLFDEFDVLMAPGQPDTAVPLSAPPEEDSEGPFDRLAPDGVSSLCGLPAITVPCGFSKDPMPLPFGVQFLGRALNDYDAIRAARLYQSKTEWHKRRPPIA